MKRSKKRLLIALLLVLAAGAFLHRRRNVAYTQEELLALAYRKANLSDTADVTFLGDYGDYDHPLLCFAASSGDHTSFHALSFNRLWWWSLGGWGEARNERMIERGPNMYIMTNDALIITNNPENAFLRPGTELVPVTEYPFCYWLGFDSDGHWPYDFLDKNGRSLIR